MKNLIVAAVLILVVGTSIVLIKIDFKCIYFTEDIKTLYAFFLGVIVTFIFVISMAIIYDKKK
jgi:hypothetical protein